MARLTCGYVDGEWGQIHYRTSGESGPAVALFHESPLSSVVWERVLPLLGERVRAFAFDTPGYGASAPPPDRDREIPDFARALRGAIDALGLERPILGGVHTGASLAIAASALGTGASGLVLTGIPLYSPEERVVCLRDYTPAIPIDDEGAQFAWAVERYRRIWGPNIPVDLLHLAVTELMRVAPRYDWAYQAAFRYDPASLLAAFEGPVLLLDSEFDSLADKDALALELARDATLSVLPGLPGQPHLREPRTYADAVFAFLDRL